jgi:hypothetical protein
MKNNAPDKKYTDLRALLDEFDGPRGKRRQMLQQGNQLGIQRMRLAICEAATMQWTGKTSFHTGLLDRVMKLVFPQSYNPNGGIGSCGPCAQTYFNKIRNEVAIIQEAIARIESPSSPRPEPQEAAAPPDPPRQMDQVVNAGSVVYVVHGGYQSASVKVGIVSQRNPVLIRLLDPVDSIPAPFQKDMVFISLPAAFNKATALHGTAASEPPVQEDGLQAIGLRDGIQAEAPKADLTTVTLPRKGDILDNGSLQAKVTSVSKGKIKLHGDGAPPEITLEEFKTQWAVVA